MTRHNSMAIADVIRDLRYDRLLVADRFAAMLAKDAKLPGSALTMIQRPASSTLGPSTCLQLYSGVPVCSRNPGRPTAAGILTQGAD